MASMRAFPDRSAKARLALWQRLLLFLLLAGFGAALVLQAEPAFRALSLALIFIFLPVIARRVFAACDLLRRACEACTAAHSGFRASALHHPRAALPRGQYARPAHRGGRAASLSRAMSRSWWCRTFTRAPSQRRSTTPAALVIYDAEDRPERDQCAKPSPRPPNLACLQAKLDLCNATDNWLTRLGARELLCQVPLMPVYWLLISDAAYRAVWQFATDPFTWEKTTHGLSHGTKRAVTPSPRAMLLRRLKPAKPERAVNTARARGR